MKVTRGRVVSVKMQKTAVVLVETRKRHPLYGKSYVYSNKYLVDDPIGVGLGDIVEFEKCKPISKRKHWRIVRVVGRDIEAIEKEVMKEVAEQAIEEVMPEEPAVEETAVSKSPPTPPTRLKLRRSRGLRRAKKEVKINGAA